MVETAFHTYFGYFVQLFGILTSCVFTLSSFYFNEEIRGKMKVLLIWQL